MDRIYPQAWIILPRDIREHLAGVFTLSKSGISEVRDQEVISDGHTIEDLGAITKERMEAYVGSSEPFVRLWELSIAKARFELNPPIELVVGGGDEVKVEEEVKEIKKNDTKKSK